MKFTDFLKSLIIFLIFLQIVPFFLRNIRDQYEDFITEKTLVGVVSFKKTLVDSEPYVKYLTHFFKDTSIKAIVLKFECGGGASGTSQTIFNEIKALKQKYPKPVIAFVENICASGAYYIACAADSIIASPAAIIGSVGAYIPRPELKEFIEQFKAKYTVIKAGTFKTAGDPFLDDSPEQHAMLQDLINSTYQQFVADVAASRSKLSVANAPAWAEGRIFTGVQALALGLIDKTGSPSTVAEEVRARVAVVGEIEWITTPEPSRFAQFFSDIEADSFAGLIANKITATNEIHSRV